MKTELVSMLAVSAALAPAGFAQSDGEVEKLRAEVDSLRTEIAELKSEDDWLTQERADQIKGLVHDVLADADTRSSLMQSGMTAGYDKGFFIGSTDGNFSLTMNGQMQIRHVYNHQDDSPIDDNRRGFEVRRTKLKFKGHVVDPSWQFKINAAFDRFTGDTVEFDPGGGVIEIDLGDAFAGDFRLEEAEIKKKLDNGMYLRFGQFKGPFLREELVSSSKQLTVERSLVNEEFNQDRSQGIEFGMEQDNFRFAAMYSDGFKTRNTAALRRTTEFAIMGRAEVLLSGDWKQFSDTTSWSGDEQGIMIGVAGAYDKDEFGTTDDGEEEIWRWTVDASLEFGGAAIFGYITGRHRSNGSDVDQYGAVIQGSYFITPDEWEAFVRYEWGDDDSSFDDLSVVTLGLNRYWNKHGLKLTSDIGFGINEVNGTWATAGAGWRRDSTDSDGQIVWRTQLQLLF